MVTTTKVAVPGVGEVDNPAAYGYTEPAPAMPSPLAARYAVPNPPTPTYAAKDVAGTVIQNPGVLVQDPTRQPYRAAAQNTVDAIRSQFASVLAGDTEEKKALETKAYLRTLASGTAASPDGAVETTKAATKGQEKYDQDVATRDAKIAEAYSNADLRDSEAFKKTQDEYLTASADQAKSKKELADKVKTEAEGEIASYATALTYDEWASKVGAKKVQQYMDETGLDDVGLKALFLKNVKNDLVDSNGTKLADGSVVFLKKVYDANGNLIGTKEVSRIKGVNGKTIKESRITDNGVQILYTDGTYETKGGPAAGENGTIAPPSSAAGKKELDDTRNWMYRQPGYTAADLDAFNTDPVFRAAMIKQAKDEGSI